MNRLKKIKLVFLLGIISLVGLFVIYNLYFSGGSSRFKKIYFNNHALDVEIADTPLLRSKGLSERKSLPRERGMLFVFDQPGHYSFWMKEMNFPLDFIWINNGEIVDLTENVPSSIIGKIEKKQTIITSRFPANQVLEINAGMVRSLNIKIRDRINFK